MNKGKLLFVPSGGLANRMRAMASAWQMAQHTGVKVETVWFCDWALNAPFHAIFAPIEHKEMTVRKVEPGNCLHLTAPENATCAFRCYFSDFVLRNA